MALGILGGIFCVRLNLDQGVDCGYLFYLRPMCSANSLYAVWKFSAFCGHLSSWLGEEKCHLHLKMKTRNQILSKTECFQAKLALFLPKKAAISIISKQIEMPNYSR